MVFKKSPQTVLSFLLMVGLFLSPLVAQAAQSPQIPLAGSAIPQFMQPLPILSVSPFANPPAPNLPYSKTMNTVFGNAPLTLRMCEFKANVLPAGAVVGYTGTWVWGYLVDPTGTSTCASLSSMYGNANGILDTYLGPVIVNNRGSISTDITFVNDLGSASTTNVLAYKYSTDQTLHWADPLANQTMANECMMKSAMMGWMVNGIPVGYPPPGDPCAQNYAGPVAAVPHLHGGEVPPEIDGSPDSWFTSDGLRFGHKYYSAAAPGNSVLYKYPNLQEAAPIWFHDHTLGATRLNVYAGLAGAYFIQDTALGLPTNLPSLPEVVPVVLQDRMFDTTGQLFFPSDTAGGLQYALNPEHPYWVPEFVGDTIVVNGKAWPFLNVEAKRYRFLLLNGSNARTYELSIPSGPSFWVTSTDGGYLDTPVMVQKLVMQPGERYEVILDFAGLSGKNLILSNSARTPYPKGAPPQGSTLGRIMQFRVGTAPAIADTSYNPAAIPVVPLRGGTQTIVRLANPVTGALAAGVTAAKTRQLTLNEVMGMAITAINPVTGLLTKYPGGPMEILVNNTKWSGLDPSSMTPRSDFTPVLANGVTTYFSEIPQEGDTEVWEIVNLTADAHPIHLHLVQFQLINRQNFNTSKYVTAYSAAFGSIGAPALPARCLVGAFCPSFGPPLNYSTGNIRALGGNPDVVPYLQGMIQPPAPYEAGWKDTVITYPGQVTRIAVRWAPTDLPTTTAAANLYYPFDPNANGQFNYVWHCHIIDHEDNEMMRPDLVTLNPAAPVPGGRPLKRGPNY